MASTDRTWPFSFENLCAALDLDASHLRRELRKETPFALNTIPIKRRRNPSVIQG